MSGNCQLVKHLLCFGAIEIFLVEGFVLVVERSELAFDEKVAHLRSEFERIAVGDDDVGDFTAFERADLIGQTKDLRWVKGDGF